MGSNHIWGSDFFRVFQTFNLSCICSFIFNNNNYNNNDDDNVNVNNDNDQPYLVRVTLDTKAGKPVALNPGSNWNLVFVEGGKPENPG